jgi:lysophospholipase L1-like esterase
LSDSIAKYVKDIPYTLVQAFRGATIGRLTAKVQDESAVVFGYDYCIVHVGTNDLCGFAVSQMLAAYINLFAVITGKSSAKIVVSAILPRPVDHKACGKKVIQVNNQLMKLCRERGILFLHSYKPFCCKGEPKRHLFAVNDGGLHLNYEGTRVLTQYLRKAIGHLKK